MKNPKEKWLPKIMERLITPQLERVPYSDEEFSKKIGISYLTYLSNKKKIQDEWNKTDSGDDVEKYMKRLEELALVGRNPKFMEMLLKIKGIYKEKSEVKLELSLSPEDLVRRNLRAESELDAEGYRVEEVPDEPTVLPEELRLGSGQGSAEDSQVAGMGAPDCPGEAYTGMARSTTAPNPALSDSVQIEANRI